MIDSSYSGSLFLTKSARKHLPDRDKNSPSRYGLASGRLQTVSDGEPGSNSPFAEALFYHLRHVKQAITVSSLCEKVVERVKANTRSDQQPIGEILQLAGHQSGKFVLHLKEDIAWEKTKKADTKEAIKAFLKSYPDSKYKNEGNELIYQILSPTPSPKPSGNTPEKIPPTPAEERA